MMRLVSLSRTNGEPGLRNSKAQVMIELTLGIIASIILIVATAQIFTWLNKCLIERQEGYQSTRTQPAERIADFYQPEKLELF